jgi:hypothetical protein
MAESTVRNLHGILAPSRGQTVQIHATEKLAFELYHALARLEGLLIEFDQEDRDLGPNLDTLIEQLQPYGDI